MTCDPGTREAEVGGGSGGQISLYKEILSENTNKHRTFWTPVTFEQPSNEDHQVTYTFNQLSQKENCQLRVLRH